MRGAMTMTVSLLMLALSLIGAMYTVKTKLFDIRITNAELRKNEAIISAEAGLQRGIAELDVALGIPDNPIDSLAESVDNNRYQVNFYAEEATLGANDYIGSPRHLKDGEQKDRIVTVTSSGFSADDTSEKIIEQKVWLFPALEGAPDSAITVSGGMGIGGSYNVAANPNGGGLGVPLSVWSDAAVTLTGNGATCGLEEYDNGVCSTFAYSDNNGLSSDVFVDSKVSDGGTFPDDVFEYVFGVATESYQQIKDEADIFDVNCNALDTTATGVVWISGDCTINAGDVVGSATEPVVLVIEDADLRLNGGAVIWGIVFSFSTDPSIPTGGSISTTGSATVEGALIADHPINIPAGTFNARYNQDVLERIENGSGRFSRIRIIPGSWKDF